MYTSLMEPYSSQLIGGASEVDQHAMVLCLIPSLSPSWMCKLIVWLHGASIFQPCSQPRPLWVMAMWLLCAPGIRGALKTEECIIFNFLYLVCILFMPRCGGGGRRGRAVRSSSDVVSRWWGLNLVFCQEKTDTAAKCVHKESLRQTQAHCNVFWVSECHCNVSIHAGSFKFIIKFFTHSFI